MSRAAGGIDSAAFERIVPSQYISFSISSPFPTYPPTLRVAVADSPSHNPSSPETTAAVLVPYRRKEDWVFSTAAGNFQLLLSLSSTDLPISRLVLIGDLLDSYSRDEDCFKESLIPLLSSLCPRSAFFNGTPPSVPFLCYEDGVIRRRVVEKLVGHAAGEMVVEEVEIDSELRRRLRFKRTPILVQTQVRLLPPAHIGISGQPEVSSLVQPYLGPMVSALFLNGYAIDEAFRRGSVPWVLCVGIGGGPLLTCLRFRVGVAVLGVEVDEVVLNVARKHFGLSDGGLLKVFVGDGIKMMVDYGLERPKDVLFHAIMVDLDEEDPLNGVGAPPVEFLKTTVIYGARMALHPEGILVINVIPSDELFYARMIQLFRMFFCELYELRVDGGGSFVIIATTSSIEYDATKMEKQGDIYQKLKELGCERFIHGIRKI